MGSTTLNRQMLTDTSLWGIKTDALGTSSGDFDSDTDLGKGVKMGAAAYVVITKDDEIEGIVNSVEPGTRNSGYSWGGVQTTGRFEAVVGVSEVGTAAVGEYVVADTPIALGTAGVLRVYPGSPSKFLWRIIRIVSGTGVAGDTVLIERI